MNAVEFHTVVENGSIEIPPELKGQILGPVRVIILTEDKPEKVQRPIEDAIGKLLANLIQLEGFEPLTRDEIYDDCVPAGRLILARQFIAGRRGEQSVRPRGTAEDFEFITAQASRWDAVASDFFPSDKSLG